MYNEYNLHEHGLNKIIASAVPGLMWAVELNLNLIKVVATS